MDAEYLKSTVHDALLEGLTAIALTNPNDKIDFLGSYLVEIVKRRHETIAHELRSNQLKEEVLIEKLILIDKENHIIELKKELNERNEKLQKFLSSMEFYKQKELIRESCNFIVDYLDVPACYFASRTLSEDKDVLKYIYSNDSQREIVVGKKLIKSGEEDLNYASFDAFKVEELENEPSESTDETEEISKTLKLNPLIIDNIMRNSSCKPFRIPKLGALALIPLRSNTLEHAEGCEKLETEEDIPIPERNIEVTAENADEETEQKDDDEKDEKESEVLQKITRVDYIPKPIEQFYLLAADTIGDYKPFQVIFLHSKYFKLFSQIFQ
jgi:hypothetical protein